MIPDPEVLWLEEWFQKTYKKAPSRQWRWAPASASWDSDEIYENFREEATTDEDEIWRAICEHELSGRWPKLSGRAAHFLRERLLAGLALCSETIRKRSPISQGVKPTRPKEPEKMIRKLIVDYWNTKGIEYWLEDNKDDFQEDEQW